MSLLIRKAGILTTVQDRGRIGYRRFGINPNGPMDPFAARVANLLVGNPENAALLEMHFPAAELTFVEATTFAISGADFGAELDGEVLAPWTGLAAKAGATLRFTRKSSGERLYIALRGGIEVPQWLGSRSTNLTAEIGGCEGRALVAGDSLQIGVYKGAPSKLPAIARSFIPAYSPDPSVRFIAGAEYERLDAESRVKLAGSTFALTPASNRMGFRLSGDSLQLDRPFELVSAATTIGTIQLLPDGQLIILMADQQTAGGYPRIGNVISCDLPLVGQLGPGDSVAFSEVNVLEAERLYIERERELSFLRAACRLAYK